MSESSRKIGMPDASTKIYEEIKKLINGCD